MARGGVAAVAVVAGVLVIIGGAALFGYVYLAPAGQHASTTTESQPPGSSLQAQSSATTSESIQISNADLSNGSLLVTVQNTGSAPVSLDAITVSPGTGCALGNLSRSAFAFNQTLPSNVTSGRFTPPACLAQEDFFVVQSNSTLSPLSLPRFNASSNFTSAFRSANFSRTFSANFSRIFSGNFSGLFPGNFSGAFPRGMLGNLSGSGLQLPAGQAVTLQYSGPIGSGVASGTQYTILVVGQQAEAQITLSAS
ncbi:MAG: hypothetical protein JRN58_01030 [Nitrososphaerota archaeon]|nr:hypothetical protein [Nitrososphaerota archaeon]MDG6977647.1 hypothetical protein [Nitrososphaerota archaeon]MDG7021847.1 hypothetical protein [Nitrososphaerota archaeon]